MTFALRPTYRRQVALNRQFRLEHLDNLYGVYCLKKVIAAYAGPLVRLRRESDNVEADYGPGLEGWIDAAAITSWLAGSTARVTTVYDQTGNSRTWSQSTALRQPLLDLAGSRPRIRFTGGTDEVFAGASTMLGYARNRSTWTMVSVHALLAAQSHTMLFFSYGTSSTSVRTGISVSNTYVYSSSMTTIDGGSTNFGSGPTGLASAWDTFQARINGADARGKTMRLDGAVVNVSTASVTFPSSDTDSLVAWWGARDDSANCDMYTTALFLVQDALTDVEMLALETYCEKLKAP